MCRCLQIASVYRVFPVGFGGMILAAQLLNALFAVLGATLLWELLRPFLPRMAVLLSIAVSAYGPFLLETANGMEMSALSAAALAMLWLIKQPQPRTTVPPTRWNSLRGGRYVTNALLAGARVSSASFARSATPSARTTKAADGTTLPER